MVGHRADRNHRPDHCLVRNPSGELFGGRIDKPHSPRGVSCDHTVSKTVQIVTGDTKVVQKGKGDGCFINTSGIGVIARPVNLSAASCRPGDAVIVSGPIGEHGITIMLARGELEIEADIGSDTAPLAALVERILDAAPRARCMRDATRGGVATVLNEIATASGVAIIVDESAVPIRQEVAGACELLGIDPLHVACKGRLVAIVGDESAQAALTAIRSGPYGDGASIIGRVKATWRGLCC
jgi:hydrogenase expression/formation protein HypE